MKKKIIVLSFALFSLSASAALPPFYQSARELRAVLDNGEVAQKLGSGRAISSISRSSENGVAYQVIAGDCALLVQVIYRAPQPGFAGPAQFDLKVGELNCLPANP